MDSESLRQMVRVETSWAQAWVFTRKEGRDREASRTMNSCLLLAGRKSRD